VKTTLERSFRVRPADSINSEIEDIYDEVTRRAFQLFVARNAEGTLGIDDWLAAERELLVKPEARVAETEGAIEVLLDTTGLQIDVLDILITPHALLIRSPRASAFPWIFRTIGLPAEIDHRSASARWDGGVVSFHARRRA